MELVDPDAAKTNVSTQGGLDNALGLGKGDMDMLQKCYLTVDYQIRNRWLAITSDRTLQQQNHARLKGKLNLPALKHIIESDNIKDKQGNPAIRCTIMCPGKNFAELC